MAGGGTNGSDGIITAYNLAEKYFVEGGVNRVILATDGDLNIGITDEDALVRLITQKASSGIDLSVLGFGTGNLADARMEALAAMLETPRADKRLLYRFVCIPFDETDPDLLARWRAMYHAECVGTHVDVLAELPQYTDPEACTTPMLASGTRFCRVRATL